MKIIHKKASDTSFREELELEKIEDLIPLLNAMEPHHWISWRALFFHRDEDGNYVVEDYDSYVE
jgi:hypothetical protein